MLRESVRACVCVSNRIKVDRQAFVHELFIRRAGGCVRVCACVRSTKARMNKKQAYDL